MKQIQRIVLISIAPLLLLTGCWWPEKFTATLDINSDRTFTFRYEGILAYAPAVAELKKSGKLQAGVENDLKQAQKELMKEEGFKSCSYKGDGRFQIVYEKSGKVDRRVDLLGENLRILSLTPTAEGIEILGMSLKASDRQQLAAIGLSLDGTVQVVSGLKVTEHNAQRSPSLGGLVGCYGWHLTMNDASPPKLVLSNVSGSKPIMTGSTLWLLVSVAAVLIGIVYARRKRTPTAT